MWRTRPATLDPACDRTFVVTTPIRFTEGRHLTMAIRTAKATAKAERTVDAPQPWLVDYGSITQMMARPFEIWLRWQADMVKAAEPVTAGWLERRREAAAAALEAVEQLASCSPTDLGRAAAIQREWLDGAMKRWNLDMEALTAHAAALAQEAGRYATRSSSPPQPSPPHRAVESEPQIEVQPVSS